METNYTTVKELIEALFKCDPDRIIILQKDSEGNGYSPFHSFYEGSYLPDSTWSGQVGLEKLTPEDEKLGYTDEDVVRGIP